MNVFLFIPSCLYLCIIFDAFFPDASYFSEAPLEFSLLILWIIIIIIIIISHV
jgi:hypothetical protein